MRKTLIVGGSVVGGLIVIVLGVVIFIFSSLDDIVKTAIETVGSEVTGTKVSVSSVKISISEGKGSIKGLAVANPKGFGTPNAFKLGEIALAIDTGSVTKDPVVIKEILVAAPEVTYEIGGPGGSNIDALQKNVETFVAKNAGAKSEAKPAEAKPAEKGKAGPKLVIDRIALTHGTVNLATPIPGGKASGTLGDIVLTGIGRDKGGASPAQVAEKVIDAVLKGAMKSAQSMGVGALLDDAQKKVMDAVPAKAVDAVPGNVGGQLKGMFGK
ncbi:MAG: hypothetical protein HY985_13815 [Magnetospirillum sp.]|nr:hypothetical protein [Magnetospirillum sp.]